MFTPITLQQVFNRSDVEMLALLTSKGHGRRSWYDQDCKRHLLEHDDLELYFSKKLEPIAREIFGDPTLKTSFSMYAKYDNEASSLSNHVDRHACVYTLDYCLSAKTIWPISVGGVDYPIKENEALAFMGMDTVHGRGPMTDPKSNQVEMVFFHFVPANHWFFEHCEDFTPDTV
jgi:hypothetical protein